MVSRSRMSLRENLLFFRSAQNGSDDDGVMMTALLTEGEMRKISGGTILLGRL